MRKRSSSECHDDHARAPHSIAWSDPGCTNDLPTQWPRWHSRAAARLLRYRRCRIACRLPLTSRRGRLGVSVTGDNAIGLNPHRATTLDAAHDFAPTDSVATGPATHRRTIGGRIALLTESCTLVAYECGGGWGQPPSPRPSPHHPCENVGSPPRHLPHLAHFAFGAPYAATAAPTVPSRAMLTAKQRRTIAGLGRGCTAPADWALGAVVGRLEAWLRAGICGAPLVSGGARHHPWLHHDGRARR